MTTNRRHTYPIIPDDPGAWSIVSFVREAQGAQLIGRGGRRKPTSAALLSDVPPQVAIGRPGLDPSLDTVGAGPIRLLAVSDEGARRLHFEDGDATLRGVHMRVVRRWSVPELVPGPHDYPDSDPAADLALPANPLELANEVDGEVVAPGGRLAAAPIKQGRLFGLALIRLPDRALVRFIGGAACAAWSSDGRLLAFGGDWGVILAESAG